MDLWHVVFWVGCIVGVVGVVAAIAGALPRPRFLVRWRRRRGDDESE